MKNIVKNIKTPVFGLLLTTSLFAAAQSSSTTVVGYPPSSEATSTTSASEAAPAAKSKWSTAFISYNAMGTEDLATLGASKATMTSDDAVAVGYATSKQYKVSVIQNFSYANNPPPASPATPTVSPYQNGFDGGDTGASIKYSSEGTIFGSKPMSFTYRYDAPNGRVSRLLKRNGIVRIGETTASWDLTPKVALDIYVSPRFYLNSEQNPNQALGSDTIGRLLLNPGFTYNFNDNFNVYYGATYDARSTQWQRGKMEMDQKNLVTHEIGANFVVGALTINPSISSDVNMNDGSSALASPSSQVLDKQANTYNLNLFANF